MAILAIEIIIPYKYIIISIRKITSIFMETMPVGRIRILYLCILSLKKKYFRFCEFSNVFFSYQTFNEIDHVSRLVSMLHRFVDVLYRPKLVVIV